MLTLGLSLASVGKPSAAGAEAEGPLPAAVEAELIRSCPESEFSVGWGAPEPDPFAFAASRGAGGGRGGLMAAALRSVEADFGLAFVPARGSATP
jgi:hypothetical protein